MLDEGGQAWLGVVGTEGAQVASTQAALDRARRALDMLGHDPGEVADLVVLTPACGLAGASPADRARAALRACREAATELG